MSTHIKRAKAGYEFQITYTGRQVLSIRDKIIDRPQPKYKHQVPKSWVTNGYVIEVKNGERICD